MYKGYRPKYLETGPREKKIDPRLIARKEGWKDYLLVLCIFLVLRVAMIETGITLFSIPYLDGWIVDLLAWGKLQARWYF
jgi:hypothetical protein